MSFDNVIELKTSEAIAEFSKFNADLNKLTTESIEVNRLISITNSNIVMIQQRTRILNKKGECLRPYALKNYGINYPKIELEKINLNPEFLSDESFYRYSPSVNPPLQLIGQDPNITSSVTQSNSQTLPPPSPLAQTNPRFKNNSPSNRTSVTSIKRVNYEEDEEDNLYFSQEKSLIKNPRH
ncbi:unnamed protein product [Brachionus calyciflorus]|uniref:Uncharacterized protein n=1 Tax=Brachionus calyciflorus TaxID=104777 RepID=A0A814J450_9BILA|nr:unnamed protein product [Brachionus calyciflorus]